MRNFTFLESYLFSAEGGENTAAVSALLCLIERMEQLYTNVQGMIAYPHVTMTMFYDVSMRWSMFLNKCVVTSSSEDVGVHRVTVPLSLESILL